MSESAAIKCKGLWGRLFGHNYKEVYSSDSIPISAKEFRSKVATVSEALVFDSSISIEIGKIQKARVTKIPDYCFCSRCGDIIEPNPMEIG